MEQINIEAFEQDKEIYFIELPNGTYLINDNRIDINWNNNKVIIDLDTPTEVYKLNYFKRIVSYKDSEGNTLSLPEYNTQRDDIYCEDESDIDSWYVYNKFLQKWNPEYETGEDKIKVNFDIKHTIYNLPSYITPMRKLNGDLKNTLYVYEEGTHIVDLVRETLLKYDYSEAKSEYTEEGQFFLKDKKSIQFSKIDKGEFMTIKIGGLREYEKVGTKKGTYQEVFEKYNKNIVDINRIITVYVQSTRKLELSSYQDILKRLAMIKDSVGSLEVKSKEGTKKRVCLGKVAELVELLERDLLR